MNRILIFLFCLLALILIVNGSGCGTPCENDEKCKEVHGEDWWCDPEYCCGDCKPDGSNKLCNSLN